MTPGDGCSPRGEERGGGAVAAPPHPVGEDWRAVLRESAESFIRYVASLPAGEQDEALRAGRDALNCRAVEIAAARRGLTAADLHREQLTRRSLPVIGSPLGIA